MVPWPVLRALADQLIPLVAAVATCDMGSLVGVLGARLDQGLKADEQRARSSGAGVASPGGTRMGSEPVSRSVVHPLLLQALSAQCATWSGWQVRCGGHFAIAPPPAPD